MASIQSLGIGSGLLTTDLVDKIVAAERKATDLRLDTRKAELQAKISAFGTIRTKVDALRTAARALGNAGTAVGNTATSSNPGAVAATATAAAEAGVHTLEVTSLARAHTIASRRFADLSAVVGTGTLTFRFGTTTFDAQGAYAGFTENTARQSATVQIDPTNDTLAGVRDAINSADIGVKASIVNDGQGYRLVLASTRTGAANSMEITATEGVTAGLSALAFNAGASTPGTNMTQTVVADDAEVAIDGIAVTRDTNTVSGVVDGVTFNLLALNPGAPAVVTLGRDEAGLAERLQKFVDSFNDVRALTDELTKFDTEKKEGSLLTGDATLRGVRAQLQRIMASAVSGLGAGGLRSLVDLGIASDQTNGYYLSFTRSALSSALARDPAVVQGLLATRQSASDSQIEFTSFGNKTEASRYEVNVTRLATQGVQLGVTLAPGQIQNAVVDDDNDALRVAVDGVQSGEVQLTHGTYVDGAALAVEIQTRINADSARRAAGVAVTVAYDATSERFEIRSARFGSNSVVAVTAVDPNVTATLGLRVDDGETGRGVDVAGSVHGIEGVGRGQALTIPSGPQPAAAGYYQGAAIAGFDTPVTLDANNSTFTVRVDGVSSGTIALTQGDYANGAALADEIETRINADATVAGAGAGVSVSWDAARQRFVLTSKRTGTASSVTFTEVPAGATTTLGFVQGEGVAGRNATTVTDPAAGIQIRVLGGAVGARGSVTFVRGVMNRIDRYLTDALSTGGLFRGRTDGLSAQLDKLEKEKAAHNDRITALETRLKTQFAAADALISRLNSTSTYLTQLSKGASSGSGNR